MTIFEIVRRAVLAVVNLDVLPRPESGWLSAIAPALLGSVLLIALVYWSGRPPALNGGREPHLLMPLNR